MPEGIFHDAHEVYARATKDDPWQWQATTATEDLAETVASMITADHSLHTEVRPV